MLGEETQLHYLKFRLPSTVCSRGGVRLDENLLSPAPKVFGDNVNVPPECNRCRRQMLSRRKAVAAAKSASSACRMPGFPRASPEIIFDASTRSEIFSRTRSVTVS